MSTTLAPYPAPARSQRIALDGGHVDLDGEGEHVELTVRLGGRIALGVALSADEAARVADALATAARRAQAAQVAASDLADVRTVGDLFERAQAVGVPASVLVEAAQR